MEIADAIKSLDDNIPPPGNRMVDRAHMGIAIAWETIKKELGRYQDLGTVEELERALQEATL